MATDVQVTASVNLIQSPNFGSPFNVLIPFQNVALALASTAKIVRNGTFTAATTYTALGLGNISTLVIAIMRNLDQTNYVDITPTNGGLATVRLLPKGIPCVFGIAAGASAIGAIANTASCVIDYTLIGT